MVHFLGTILFALQKSIRLLSFLRLAFSFHVFSTFQYQDNISMQPKWKPKIGKSYLKSYIMILIVISSVQFFLRTRYTGEDNSGLSSLSLTLLAILRMILAIYSNETIIYSLFAGCRMQEMLLMIIQHSNYLFEHEIQVWYMPMFIKF